MKPARAAPHPITRRTEPNPLKRCQTLRRSSDVRPSSSTSIEMPEHAANDVTGLLRAWGAGDAHASETVAPLIYSELRRQAGLALRRESEGHTLQTTALVHEAWLRLDAQREAQWESRTQFYAVAAQMMRRILVDHARRRQSLKRGAAPAQVTLETIDREG